MPKYLIRRNINGRPLEQMLTERPNDDAALARGMELQEQINAQFSRKEGRKRAPAATVEVLKLLWSGVPKRSEHPEAIRSIERRKKELAEHRKVMT